MNLRKAALPLIMLVAMSFPGCRAVVEIEIPEATFIKITGETEIEKSGSEQTVKIPVETDGSYETVLVTTSIRDLKEDQTPWIETEFTGNELTLHLAANDTADDRYASVTLSGKRVREPVKLTVKQLSKLKFATRLDIEDAEEPVERNGMAAELTFDVDTDGDFNTISVKVTDDDDTEAKDMWLSAEYTQSGKLRISLEANKTGDRRKAFVILSAARFEKEAVVTVVQNPLLGPVKSISLDPAETDEIPYNGETRVFDVIAAGDDADRISVSADRNWIIPAFDYKTMKLTVTVEKNTPNVPRSGNVFITAKEGASAKLAVSQRELQAGDKTAEISIDLNGSDYILFEHFTGTEADRTLMKWFRISDDDYKSVTASSDKQWLKVNYNPEVGNFITLTADEWLGEGPRTATLTLSAPQAEDVTVTVKQMDREVIQKLELSVSDQLPSESLTFETQCWNTTNSPFPIIKCNGRFYDPYIFGELEVTCDQTWADPVITSHSGLRVTFEKNPIRQDRVAYINIKSRHSDASASYTIIQEHYIGHIKDFTLEPEELQFIAEGGTSRSKLTVLAPEDYDKELLSAWKCNPEHDFFDVSFDHNTMEVVVTMDSHDEYNDRIDSIFVGGNSGASVIKMMKLRQFRKSPDISMIEFNPSSYTFARAGETKSFYATISGNRYREVTMNKSEDWINAEYDNENRKLTVTLDENTGGTREGRITLKSNHNGISGDFTVRQSGYVTSIALDKGGLQTDCNGIKGEIVKVIAEGDDAGQIKVTSSESWAQAVFNPQTMSIRIDVDAHTGIKTRMATVRIEAANSPAFKEFKIIQLGDISSLTPPTTITIDAPTSLTVDGKAATEVLKVINDNDFETIFARLLYDGDSKDWITSALYDGCLELSFLPHNGTEARTATVRLYADGTDATAEIRIIQNALNEPRDHFDISDRYPFMWDPDWDVDKFNRKSDSVNDHNLGGHTYSGKTIEFWPLMSWKNINEVGGTGYRKSDGSGQYSIGYMLTQEVLDYYRGKEIIQLGGLICNKSFIMNVSEGFMEFAIVTVVQSDQFTDLATPSWKRGKCVDIDKVIWSHRINANDPYLSRNECGPYWTSIKTDYETAEITLPETGNVMFLCRLSGDPAKAPWDNMLTESQPDIPFLPVYFTPDNAAGKAMYPAHIGAPAMYLTFKAQ